MNLHLKTLAYIIGFVGVIVLTIISAQHYPVFTITGIAIFLLIAFYNLIYSMLKIEQSIDELKKR